MAKKHSYPEHNAGSHAPDSFQSNVLHHTPKKHSYFKSFFHWVELCQKHDTIFLQKFCQKERKYNIDVSDWRIRFFPSALTTSRTASVEGMPY